MLLNFESQNMLPALQVKTYNNLTLKRQLPGKGFDVHDVIKSQSTGSGDNCNVSK